MGIINLDYDANQKVLLIQRICQILITLVGKGIPKHETKPGCHEQDEEI